MMHILEALVQSEEYSYLRLDGTTPMGQRQQTIEKFNTVSYLKILLYQNLFNDKILFS